MGMTKIVASLMLSTALLPAMLSKADTTATPSTNQETVEPASATKGATNESTASGTANQTHLVITSATSQSTSATSTVASVAPSAAAQNATSATTASQTSSSSVQENNVASQDQVKSAAPVDQTSAATSKVTTSAANSTVAASADTSTATSAGAQSAATSATTSTAVTSADTSTATSAGAQSTATSATTNTAAASADTSTATSTVANSTSAVKNDKSAATSVTSAQTSVANANSATADDQHVASHAVVTTPELAVTKPDSAAAKPVAQPTAKPVVTPAPAKPKDSIQPAAFTPEADTVLPRVSPHQYFLNEIKPGAISGWSKYHVLPSITAAQAILESGWGGSQLSQVGNNLFGIKGSYNGQSIYFKTQEWNGHQYITITAAFRKYPNWAASVEDHGAFLVENSRYRNLLGVTDYRKVATLLQQDGYATSPTYASLLISIINSNQLYDWDREAFSGQTVVNPGNNNQNYVVPESGRYTFTHTTAIHTTANTNSAVVGTYNAGESVYYNAKIESNGQTWLQYLSYSGTNHYVMIKGAQSVAPSTPSQTLPTSGSYTFKANTNIRNGASKGAAIVGHYDAGQTVNYNGTVQADGLTWLRYVSYSGTTHYVATSGDNVVAAPKPHVENVSGSYQFTQNTAIKSAPTNASNTVGTYNAGERVYYNAKVTVGNQTWLRYVSYSGATHYVEVAAAGHVDSNASQAVVTPATGAYRFTQTTAIKTAADRNSATVGTYYAGNTVYYNAKVTVNGQTWLRYQSYSGANHYVEIGAVTGQPDWVNAQKGSFRFTTTTNIRTAPTTHAAVVGEYYAGDVVYYDGTVKAEGYTWLRYLSRSGAIHYVAIVH